MDLNLLSEIYGLIAEASSNMSSRQELIKLRELAFSNSTSKSLIKIAFDTRRIDQETEYNPRRGLQFYNRSESFMSEGISSKIEHFKKLKSALESLKKKYGKKPDWQDSYARVTLNFIDRALRTNEQDGDYTDNQPGVGSFDYIEEMLYVRYRLSVDDLAQMSEEDLKKAILSKDAALVKDVNDAHEITRSDAGAQSYDTLLEKLFGGVKATAENPEVERTVTITIKDKFIESK